MFSWIKLFTSLLYKASYGYAVWISGHMVSCELTKNSRSTSSQSCCGPATLWACRSFFFFSPLFGDLLWRYWTLNDWTVSFNPMRSLPRTLAFKWDRTQSTFSHVSLHAKPCENETPVQCGISTKWYRPWCTAIEPTAKVHAMRGWYGLQVHVTLPQGDHSRLQLN